MSLVVRHCSRLDRLNIPHWMQHLMDEGEGVGGGKGFLGRGECSGMWEEGIRESVQWGVYRGGGVGREGKDGYVFM